MKYLAIALVAILAAGCHSEKTTIQTDKPVELTGYVPNKNWAYRDSVTFLEPTPEEKLPTKFDVRDLMASAFPAPRQQQCGDCWAWSTHHAFEMAHMLIAGKFYDHSVQSVLSCSGEGSCGGGDMDAVDFLKHGLPLESEFPYKNGTTGRCKYTKADIETGWDPKMISTPYLGSSLNFSRGVRATDGDFESRPTVRAMKTAIFKYKAPLVVTVSAYSADSGDVITSCSAINDGGNHMVAIPGYDDEGGHDNAHVYNSWGSGHGDHGVSRIKWECGAGKLNRGLGVSAKVVIYKPECQPPKIDLGKATDFIIKGKTAIKLGTAQPSDVKCEWLPAEGLSDPHSCVTFAEPMGNTEYHLRATNNCGTVSAMKLVEVYGPAGERGGDILTPSGRVMNEETL